MLVLAIVFIAVSFLGQPLLPVPPMVQLFGGLAVISSAFIRLGHAAKRMPRRRVVHDALRTGQSNEGMFFAARTFLQKIGMTLGIMTFASLTNFDKLLRRSLAGRPRRAALRPSMLRRLPPRDGLLLVLRREDVKERRMR